MMSNQKQGSVFLQSDLDNSMNITLSPADKKVLRYLGELIRSSGEETCTASIPRIAEACDISKRQVQLSAKRLIGAKLLERIGYDFSNPDRSKRGTVYGVLPKAGGTRQSVTVKERKRTIKFLLIWSEE